MDLPLDLNFRIFYFSVCFKMEWVLSWPMLQCIEFSGNQFGGLCNYAFCIWAEQWVFWFEWKANNNGRNDTELRHPDFAPPGFTQTQVLMVGLPHYWPLIAQMSEFSKAVTFWTGLQRCWDIMIFSDEPSFLTSVCLDYMFDPSSEWCVGLVVPLSYRDVCCNSTQTSSDLLPFISSWIPSTIHEGTLNVSMGMEMMPGICFGPDVHQISTQISIHIRVWAISVFPRSTSRHLREHLMEERCFLF